MFLVASKKTSLMVVGPDDQAPDPKRVEIPETLQGALKGSRFQFLAAMRKQLVDKISADEISSNAIASTFKELREIDRLMRAEIRSAEGGSSDDDLEDEDFDPLAI